VITLKENEGVGRWVLQQAGDSAPFNVTIGFTATNIGLAGSFIAAMVSGWHDELRDSTTTDLTCVEANGLWFDGTNEHSLLEPLAEAGTGGTGVLPSNCSLLVRKNTSFAGRAFRGRMYWPSMLAEGDVDINGIIDGAVVTALQGHFDTLFDDYLDSIPGAVPSLLHDKVTDDVLDPTLATPLTSLTVQPKIATQRRRMRGSS